MSQFSCSRRTFFIATATTAAGALLAACASEDAITTASTSEIPVGEATIIEGWVVSHPTEGEFRAFSTHCPHAGGVIDHFEEVDGTTAAVCPKHMSKFDINTGDVLEGPSRDPMTPAKNVEVNGQEISIS